ncbi:hypothetical protein ESCO_002763 [Escovopsis weberi]|uniref:Uncharacterized protein n=1 Tax=Escovopsis weberi TaxID=150374 RepID=A0A0M9VSZ0_ESCWE|nr:hypothetical protein ESCO_002763 [Escovopsis weberi]
MKLTVILLASIAAAANDTPRMWLDNCFMQCSWGYGYCERRPASCRCDQRGSVECVVGLDECRRQCWCLCDVLP